MWRKDTRKNTKGQHKKKNVSKSTKWHCNKWNKSYVMFCSVCCVQFYYFLAVTSGGHNLNKTITALCYSSLFWWKYCYDQVLIAAFKVTLNHSEFLKTVVVDTLFCC